MVSGEPMAMGARPSGGFTLVELMVVILIIGILAAFAVPAYLRSVETTKADDAAAIMSMVAATNRMFALDHQNAHASGTLATGGLGCRAGDPCPASGPYQACALVACKYLAAQDWDSKSYEIAAADPNGGSSCLSLGSGGSVACVRRKTSGTASTTLSPYKDWGYTMDASGVITPYGNAPEPVR